MKSQTRYTREELMKFLKSIAFLTLEEQEAMATTFGQYDREIQEEFIRNLPLTIEKSENSVQNA